MARRNHTRSTRALVLSAILALLLALPATVVGRDPVGPATVAAEPSADLSSALAADGTFLGGSGVAGTVDTSAWTLVSDLAAGEAPRFARAGLAVSTTPIGPWSALGSNGAGNGALWNAFFVRAIAISGTKVYVGGLFENAAGIATADNVAMWNGSSWSALGSNGYGDGALEYGAGAGVFALAVSGSDLYVGGIFSDAAGIATADFIAKWNGSTWSGLGSNGAGDGALSGGRVWAIAVSGSDLYVGGGFGVAGIATADNVAMWNGSSWSALGSNGLGGGALNGYVAAIAISGTTVFAGGAFTDAAGIATADRVAKWNGSSWSALGSNGSGDGALNGTVFSLAVSGSDLYVGGSFVDAAGVATADHIAKWNGAAWSALGSDGVRDGALNWDAWELMVSGTDLYVGGGFSNAAGIAAADYVAKWNGSAWSALGSNGSGDGAINSTVWAFAIAANGGSIYVGGEFDDAAGIAAADDVARWGLTPLTDIAGSPFEADIIWVYLQGITSGCTATTYCPLAPVTRAQMASFLARALHLSGAAPDAFTDDESSIHEPNINLVAQAGIASGCAPSKFCPDGLVSREQMASFLARALHLSGPAPDAFTDDNTSIHEPNINLVAREGIATGCGGTKYCPTANVTRGQMAAFLHRAFGP